MTQTSAVIHGSIEPHLSIRLPASSRCHLRKVLDLLTVNFINSAQLGRSPTYTINLGHDEAFSANLW